MNKKGSNVITPLLIALILGIIVALVWGGTIVDWLSPDGGKVDKSFDEIKDVGLPCEPYQGIDLETCKKEVKPKGGFCRENNETGEILRCVFLT